MITYSKVVRVLLIIAFAYFAGSVLRWFTLEGDLSVGQDWAIMLVSAGLFVAVTIILICDWRKPGFYK